MSDAAIFLWFFGGLFVLRIIAATFVYAWLLSDAPECPSCGRETLRVERHGIDWLFPKLRPSWCPACGWDGLLHPIPRAPGSPRELPVQPTPENTRSESRPGLIPVDSKKSAH